MGNFTSKFLNQNLRLAGMSILGLFLLGISPFVWVQSSHAGLSQTDPPKIASQIAKFHIPFIANQGQTEERVKFYAKTFGGTVFITKDGEIVYSLPQSLVSNRKSKIKNQKSKGLALKEELVGGRVSDVTGVGKAITRISYYRGSDPSKWKNNIPTYDYVCLGEVYEGVELRLKAYGNNVEKLFSVKPGANPDRITVKLNGSKAIKVNVAGDLELETDLGAVKFSKPVAYQEDNGKKKYVDVAYAVNGNEYGFKVQKYDIKKELIIDPLLTSTFLGGGSYDMVHSMIIDSSGNVYVGGPTSSSDFPTVAGAYDTTYTGVGDAFVSKFDADLQNLLASTYLGGSGTNGDEVVKSIAIDNTGNVYVAGKMRSSDFPTTPNAHDTTYNGAWDGFISKLDTNLQILHASTFLGGGSYDMVDSMIIDSSGNVYVSGRTESSGFPTTPGAYDPTHNGSRDAFVSKLDANLQNLQASTFLGGGGYDYGLSMAIDSSGNVYMAGSTQSSSVPTTSGAYDTTYNGGIHDAYVSKFDANLENLLASTLLGGSGSGQDEANSLIIDNSGTVYVVGFAESSDFPTTSGAYDTTHNGSRDAYVSKFDSNLENLLVSTFLGGGNEDTAYSITQDSSENIFVAGYAGSGFPTTSDAYDTSHNGGYDVFVSKLDGNLTNLLYSTFIGGGNNDTARSMDIDGNGNVYVAGETYSSDFPTTSEAYNTTYGGSGDAFVTKLSLGPSAQWNIETVDSIGDVGAINSIAVDNTGVIHIIYMEKTSEYQGNLKYARYENGSWSIQTLDDSGKLEESWGNSIVLDSNSHPHFVYGANYGGGDRRIYYFKWNGSSWESLLVPDANREGPRLALDSNDNPHISSHSSPNDDLHHHYWDGSFWVDETVDTTYNCGRGSSIIVIGDSESIYISHHTNANNIRFSKWNGSSWSTETVDQIGQEWQGGETSMQLDLSGYPSIAYGAYGPKKLKYAKYDGSAWATEIVDDMSFYYFSSSLAIDNNGQPNIAYYGGDQTLRFAQWDGSQWTKETIDSNVMQALSCSLGIDSNGTKYIAYYDGTHGDLKLAKFIPYLPGLVAYYPFNGNANDESGNENHGTAHDAVLAPDRFGNPDAAYSFDGTNDYIDVNDNGSLSGMPNLTVAFAFKADYWPVWETDNGGAGLVIKENNGDGYMGSDCYGLSLVIENNQHIINAVVYSGTAHSAENTANVTGVIEDFFPNFDPNDWHYVALTYDGNMVRLYFDGTQIGTGAFSKTLNSNIAVPLRIGHIYGSSVHNLYFNGIIDEVRIYNRALSEAEIKAIWHGECADAYLEGYYLGTEELEQAIADATANLYNADGTRVSDGSKDLFTHTEVNQAVSDAEAAKDTIIAQKDQTISDLNTTIGSMYTEEQINQEIARILTWGDINGDGKIGLEEAIRALRAVSGIAP